MPKQLTRAGRTDAIFTRTRSSGHNDSGIDVRNTHDGDVLGIAPHVRPLRLRSNIVWTFLGNGVYAATQWAMLIVLAKLTSPTVVGRFALSLAVTAPVFMLANLQLRGIQATDARGEHEFGDYLGLRLLTTPLACTAIGLICLLSVYPAEVDVVIVAIAVAKAWEAISDVLYGLFQRKERMDVIAKSRMIKAGVALCAFSAGVYLTRDALWGVIGLALAWLLLLFLYDLPMAAAFNRVEGEGGRIRPRFGPAKLRQLAILAFPLGITLMLSSLNTNVPRYVIETLLGEGSLGIFAAIAYLMATGIIVIDAIGQSATPRLANLFAAGRISEYLSLLLKLIAIAASLGVAGIGVAAFFGRKLLAIIYTPEYGAHSPLLLWIMIAAGLHYVASIFGYAMTAARLFKSQLPLLLAVVVATGVACLLFIPHHGIKGGALGLVAGVFTQLVGSGIILAAALRSSVRARSP